jgi:hypothetical protein
MPIRLRFRRRPLPLRLLGVVLRHSSNFILSVQKIFIINHLFVAYLTTLLCKITIFCDAGLRLRDRILKVGVKLELLTYEDYINAAPHAAQGGAGWNYNLESCHCVMTTHTECLHINVIRGNLKI